jgi:hypothetical protein
MQSEIIPKLGQFLASTAGGIIVATLIGALGLFTWQRRDWVFKEQYHLPCGDGRVEILSGGAASAAHAHSATAITSIRMPSEPTSGAT